MQRLADAVICPAGPSDAVDLARVHITAWRETYSGLLPRPYLEAMSVARHAKRWSLQLMRPGSGEVVLAAEAPDGLVGYCAGGAPAQPGRPAEIFTLYVVRSAQRRGLGKGLLVSTARALEAKGASSLQLWVLNDNAPARAFYHRLGAHPVGERDVGRWSGGLKETLYSWKDIGILTR
jgi:ribosomal protein S18 acetylase RimI-like enzyme